MEDNDAQRNYQDSMKIYDTHNKHMGTIWKIMMFVETISASVEVYDIQRNNQDSTENDGIQINYFRHFFR